VAKKDKDTFEVKEAGAVGRDIYNNIVTGLTQLTPISGRIQIEVKMKLKDDNVFKDDELREAKLLIEVDLGEKK
jgi:hypothetical protein